MPPGRRAASGHEDAFPRPRLSARCRFSQGTFAGKRGNGRDAPFAVVPRDGCGWTFSLPPTCDDLPMSRSFVGLIDPDIIDGQDGSARSRMSITPDGTLADP